MERNSNKHSFRLPAEWERQECIQLTWPHKGTDWAPVLSEITDVYVEMACEIAKREKLIIVTQEGEEAIKPLLEERLDDAAMANVAFFRCDNDDTWARDHGFITLTCGERKRLLDFRFNGWGEKFKADLDNAINAKLAATIVGEYKDRLEYVDMLDFVLEGGSIESDGKGTVMTTSQCLLAPHRNQPMTKEDIERRLKESLCAERVLWLDHGNLIGDDTDGHIDTIVRFAPDDTLLYVACEDTQDEQYEDFKLLTEQLRELRTAEGKPYRLMSLPMPDAVYDEDGGRLPATYANFVVLNGAVLVPVYGQKDNDAEAVRVIGEAFPGREIVPIDSRAVILQHGSLHCCTMQYPL